MKLNVVLFALVTLSLPAFAGPQQEKMKTCNADAASKHLAGDARKDFMKSCLSSAGAAADAAAQDATAATNAAAATAADAVALSPRERMKDCNVKAKGMNGAERKTFMSSCLKSK